MPRVKLSTTPQQKRDETRRNLIDGKAHARGYRRQGDVARTLGKPDCWYGRRLNGKNSWTLDDVAELDRVLRFSAEELTQIVRGKV